MSILQIAKIQHRSGNLTDLPQLDQAELGFASDVNRLFIGKTVTVTENIEILTAYSDIAFNQITGSVGNLNIAGNVANNNILMYSSGNWINSNTISVANITVSGTANLNVTRTSNLTTGANTNVGLITGNWNLTPGSYLQSGSADLAEYYAADEKYLPGTVLEFGGDQEVTLAGIESNKLAGVVSTEPAYMMNSTIKADHPVVIALVGRVPVKVIGPISKGDMLVSAGNGLAKSMLLTPKIGTVIGKAIATKTDENEGIIEVMIGKL
jgi:hypothetical protein